MNPCNTEANYTNTQLELGDVYCHYYSFKLNHDPHFKYNDVTKKTKLVKLCLSKLLELSDIFGNGVFSSLGSASF